MKVEYNVSDATNTHRGVHDGIGSGLAAYFQLLSQGENMMHIANDAMDTLPFQLFRKTTLLQARPLTEDDYQQRGGLIQTDPRRPRRISAR